MLCAPHWKVIEPVYGGFKFDLQVEVSIKVPYRFQQQWMRTNSHELMFIFSPRPTASVFADNSFKLKGAKTFDKNA